MRPSSPAAQVRRKFAGSSPEVRRKRTVRENGIMEEPSARPPVAMASGRTQPYPRRLDATWANVGNPGLCRAGLGGGGRRGGLCTIFHEVEAGGALGRGSRGGELLAPHHRVLRPGAPRAPPDAPLVAGPAGWEVHNCEVATSSSAPVNSITGPVASGVRRKTSPGQRWAASAAGRFGGLVRSRPSCCSSAKRTNSHTSAKGRR
jgi:hypothetical protein